MEEWKQEQDVEKQTQKLESGAGGELHCGAELKQSYSPGQSEEEKPQRLLNFPKTVFLPSTPLPTHTHTHVHHRHPHRPQEPA